ncbi:protein-glutamate methylesterase/protein-glutamine glutaminase [Craterilacuibacter sp.]|uniref:protein-glutamate methylesterase/protein-glutamine glutaminase n=1 Tax=Craterilacuibacter sp. TaxID=2870909 RepID=UPI003F3A2998
MSAKLSVMIIDDSAVVRKDVSRLLSATSDIEVIATAADPVFAIAKLRQRWPDVIMLGIEMQHVDGLAFLRKIMTERPTPVVICSSLAYDDKRVCQDALAAGAVAILPKPKSGLQTYLHDAADEIMQVLRSAGRTPLPARKISSARSASRTVSKTTAKTISLRPRETTLALPKAPLIAIGASTGGTLALEQLLVRLPPDCPGIVIVQHMPEKFTKLFALRLNSLCALEVREACDGDRVHAGCVLIAPGGRHMKLLRRGTQYHVAVTDGERVNRHKPSVDVLFHSVAQAAASSALGIILTGMGSDGALGLKAMHDAGARTLAQDEASCVVYGMPAEAVRLQAVDHILALDAIADAIKAFCRRSHLNRPPYTGRPAPLAP